MIPEDNPFVDAPGRDEIWAWGLRNPWRFSFDPATADLYIADVGQAAKEEVNVAAGEAAGVNYGWNVMEGKQCRGGGQNCNMEGFTLPVLDYSHTGGACSVTGGSVYRGNDLPWLRGHYFYADFCAGWVKSFRNDDGVASQQRDWAAAIDPPSFPTSFGVDGLGELYVLGSGSVKRFAPTKRAACDFDADGRSDLSIGSPGEGLPGAVDAGVAQVLPGSASGPDANSSQLWDQRHEGIPGEAERNDAMGSSFACGDFDADGYDDLAIGAPGETLAGSAGAGAVVVLEGSAAGLTADSARAWHQDVVGMKGVTEPEDSFGYSLAAGDFDGDGRDDLAIGIPHESVGVADGAGAVAIVYGSSSGLRDLGDQLWHQASAGIVGQIEQGDGFGSSLATGDFNGDGVADLAVGVPDEDIGSVASAGAINVLLGSSRGLTADGNHSWHRGSGGIKGTVQTGARFGSALAVGHFDRGGFDDLAVGAPGSDSSRGDVSVLYGGATGVTARDQIWRQGGDVAGVPEAGDGFGAALAAGDIDGDRNDDLAIGVPGEALGPLDGAGSVTVLFGGALGIHAVGDETWHQDRPGIKGQAEEGDDFGSSLRIADYDGDGFGDLVIGIPGEDLDGQSDAGAVAVIFGRADGLHDLGDKLYAQNTDGIAGNVESGDWFGSAV